MPLVTTYNHPNKNLKNFLIFKLKSSYEHTIGTNHRWRLYISAVGWLYNRLCDTLSNEVTEYIN
uniref:Uncharacterized protein n=1 Tax=Meloidogyne enterolobii TaxID=390850 RepID=A0A6V7VEC5_MELEN|nr:unnamed protein product [Meloidogyne enterolobii]